MERPARLAIKLLISVLASVSFACSFVQRTAPLQALDADKAAITTSNGLLYYVQQPFTGVLYRLGEKGDTLFSETYLDGLQDGRQCYRYMEGTLKEIAYFEAGKKTGTHLGYWPDGSKRFIRHYANDMYEGEQCEWYPSGQAFKCTHYKDGHENGLIQEWDEDGHILANYEARNGRNYGNIGVKHCSSKWKN